MSVVLNISRQRPKELRVFGRQPTIAPGTSPQKQRFELKTFTPREYLFKDLRHIFTIFQKIADLQADSALIIARLRNHAASRSFHMSVFTRF